MLDLISSSLPNSRIVSLSDEFFASASNLVTPGPPIHKPGVFISTGAWYDGWETRRHNPHPYDYVIIRLGVDLGRVKGIEIDTTYFTGNNAEAASVERCRLTPHEDIAEGKVLGTDFSNADQERNEDCWEPLLPKQNLSPSTRHAWLLPERKLSEPTTHVRLRMYPDGGIARFRLHGLAELEPLPSLSSFPPGNNNYHQPSSPVVNLAGIESGALVTSWSDAHYGRALNLLLPGRGKDMGDGWETKRSRTPGHEDWCVIRLCGLGVVEKIGMDTKDFKGNYPKMVRVEGRREEGKGEWVGLVREGDWEVGADMEHEVVVGGGDVGQEKREREGEEGRILCREVKVVMIPDGGIKRVRVWGRRVA